MGKGGVLSMLVYALAFPEDVATTIHFNGTMFACAFGIVYVGKLVLIPERTCSAGTGSAFYFREL